MSSLPLDPARSLPTTQPKGPDASLTPVTPITPAALNPTDHARQIVRLVQCPHCSRPFEEPVTLPCGSSICKRCIPDLHLRLHISYPATANRLQGFICPIALCRREHAVGDCAMDVVLNNVMTGVREAMQQFAQFSAAVSVLLQVEETEMWLAAGVSSLQEKRAPMRVRPGGRITATYELARSGELAYDAEVTYMSHDLGGPLASNTNVVYPPGVDVEALDISVLDHLKLALGSELDCQVCYALFLDPVTTACGHTFCRKCLHRVLDHSTLCPVCRRPLSIPPALNSEQGPSNIAITNLLTGLFTGALAARVETAASEELSSQNECDTALFVCTLSFPTMPTFLHIFEPRYRLMIRRTMATRDRNFGMVAHNPTHATQGGLGAVPFHQYGTLLHIINIHMMPDGRSLIETVGVSRFKVVRHGALDGYLVGKLERVDDISLAAEEAFEAAETSNYVASTPRIQPSPYSSPPSRSTRAQATSQAQEVFFQDLETMPTQELMKICTTFVQKMRGESAPWLHQRIIQAYGECPEDPALFPWWFATVLPTTDEEKYQLLATSSVRERLKVCARWIARIQVQHWNQSSGGCTVL